MMRIPAALWTIAMLAVLLLAPAARAQDSRQDACSRNGPVSLYLGAGNAMTPTVGAEGSAPFPAQAKVSVAFAWLVGTWESPKLGAALSYSGNVNFSIWAKASGAVQVNTHFQVYFGVNGARGASSYPSGTGRLGSTPKEFKGTAAGVHLGLNPGDTVSFFVYVSERGSGGSVVYGGSYPSRMELGIQPLGLNLSVQTTPGELKVTGGVSDIWGRMDVTDLTLAVMGPFPKVDDSVCGRSLYDNRTKLVKAVTEDKLSTEETDSDINFTFNWKYDSAGIAPGTYIVVIMAGTFSNSTLDDSSWQSLQSGKSGFSLSGTALVAVGAVAVIAVAGVGGGLYYTRRARKAGSLAGNTKAVAAVGVVLMLVVVAGLYLAFGQTSGGTQKAPGFNLTDVNGKPVSLASYQGSVVVLDMMATWCSVCNQEIPQLKDFHSKHPDVVIISIDIDRTENSAKLKEHMESAGCSWTYAMDSGSVMDEYQVTNIPKIVVVTPSGYITFMKADLVKSDELATVTQTARSGSAPILALGGEMGFATLAFLAGISAFFSPCAFPLLPGYMTYYLGRDSKEAADRKSTIRKALIGGIAAAAGVLIIYAFMGVLVAGAGVAVKQYVGYLAPVVAVIILVMGLVMLTRYDIPLYRVTAAFNPVVNAARKGLGRLAGRKEGAEPGQYAGLLSYGAGYGAASLGCHAPIFIAVVMAGLVAGGVGSALLAFVMYALGMGLFLVIVTVMVGMAKNTMVKRMQQWMPVIKKISGIVLVIVGVALLYIFYQSQVH